MAKKPTKRILLAQNFLRSPGLARSLLSISSIGSQDLVYEIGPGRGILTAELARIAGRVIAIEKDPDLAQFLRRRFQEVDHVTIVAGDYLSYAVPDRQYKIFASIPYNVTAEIVRKILFASPVPEEAYLIMQKEAAQKFAGSPRETQFSILAKPTFDIRICKQLRKTDFQPVPRVDSVLLHVRRRPEPLIRAEDVFLYRRFVRYGFGTWKHSLQQVFKPVFTYAQWKHLSSDLKFPLDVTPSRLTLEQWLGLFESFKQRVPRYKWACIR